MNCDASEILVTKNRLAQQPSPRIDAQKDVMMKTGMTRKILAIGLLSVFALSACGIKGDLKTPPPLWGDSDKPAEQAEQAEQPNP